MSRLNVEIAGEAGKALERLSQHTSKAEAIRKALSIASWVDETQQTGKKILVEDERGRLREVYWR